MSDDHKAALAKGREDGRKVRAYLEALAEVNRPKARGRKKSPEAIQARLDEITAEYPSAEPLQKLLLVNEQIGLEEDLEAITAEPDPVDYEALERGFIEAAAAFTRSKRIVWLAWRSVGVPATLLRAAGIER